MTQENSQRQARALFDLAYAMIEAYAEEKKEKVLKK